MQRGEREGGYEGEGSRGERTDRREERVVGGQRTGTRRQRGNEAVGNLSQHTQLASVKHLTPNLQQTAHTLSSVAPNTAATPTSLAFVVPLFQPQHTPSQQPKTPMTNTLVKHENRKEHQQRKQH